MNRNVSQTALILGVEGEQVKTWAWLFKEYLSPQANPAKGSPRSFSDSDLLALMHVAMHWEEQPDKIEALVQTDFEIVSEIASARDSLTRSYGSNEIESAWFHLDVLAALGRQWRCGLLHLRIVAELYVARAKLQHNPSRKYCGSAVLTKPQVLNCPAGDGMIHFRERGRPASREQAVASIHFRFLMAFEIRYKAVHEIEEGGGGCEVIYPKAHPSGRATSVRSNMRNTASSSKAKRRPFKGGRIPRLCVVAHGSQPVVNPVGETISPK